MSGFKLNKFTAKCIRALPFQIPTYAMLLLQYAGALLGLSNTFGAFPGVLGVTAVGFLLDKTGVWSAALFLPCAFCQLVGLVVYTLLASSERRTDWA